MLQQKRLVMLKAPILTILLFSSLLVCLHTQVFSQDSTITVRGKIIQHPPIGFSDLLIINAGSGRGLFGNPDGTFSIEIDRGDEIKISSRGFSTISVSFRDSVYKPVYDIVVEMNELQIVFDKPVIIRPQQTLEELEAVKARIGSHRYDPVIKSGISGLSSPFSALFQAFSKEEEQKRKYIELMNRKEMEDALKDVIRYLNYSGLFEVDEDEMDLFIATCPLDPEFVRYSTLYDLSTALEVCHRKFKSKRRY